MQKQVSSRSRPGALTIESAVVFLVFFVLIVGLLDLSIATFRYNLISEAARHTARQAIVHGSLAAELGPWGPSTVGPSPGTSLDPVVESATKHMSGIDLNSVTVEAVWLDGNNQPGDRVQITISAHYQPILTYIFGSKPIHFQACSVMVIAH
ncbi:MAG: TadE/TadG family type IV pilus assembly protein [Bdellovibrionales bacterium]